MEFTSYDAALAHIHGLPRLKRSNSRAELKQVLAALDHPERVGQYVHVTGTNGKGSTSNAIAHILQASGCTVGLFTSPFIMRFNERIQVDNVPVSDKQIRVAAGRVQTAIDQLRATQPDLALKEFEFLTCMAFLLFAAAGTDVNVVEVGIGGEHDSTNVLTPLVSVITNVALDHMEILGNTIAKIATEKAGIIKPGARVVLGALPEEARLPILTHAFLNGSPVDAFGEEFNATGKPDAASFGERVTYIDDAGQLKDLFFPLLGDYQVVNAAVAIRAAKRFAEAASWPLTNAEIKRGLAASSWPVRLERVSESPLLVLDGAHNPDGLGHVLAQLRRLRLTDVTIIAGILADKSLPEMLGQLKQSGARIVLTTVPHNPRAASVDDYAAAGNTEWPVLDWHDALAATLQTYGDDPVIILGSLYLAAAVRQELLGD